MKFVSTILAASLTGFATCAQMLVLPGDYPDPSVVKINGTYWVSATTSNWFPAFPLIRGFFSFFPMGQVTFSTPFY